MGGGPSKAGPCGSPLIPASFASTTAWPSRAHTASASLAVFFSRPRPAPSAMSDRTAAAIVLAGAAVGGGLLCVSGSLDRIGNRVSAFLPGWEEVSFTLSNGPRRPWLAQLFAGRCVTAAAAAVQAKLGWYAPKMRLLHVMLTGQPLPLAGGSPACPRALCPTRCSEAARSGNPGQEK